MLKGLIIQVLLLLHMRYGSLLHVPSLLIVGYKFSRASYVLSLLRPQVYNDLELKVCERLWYFVVMYILSAVRLNCMESGVVIL